MNKICFSAADVLLPKTDFEHWAVIACDQYTSEPEYWEKAQKFADKSPSALHLVFPEVYLGDGDDQRIETINLTMNDYLSSSVFTEYKDTMIYIERRQSDGKIRHGLLGKIDLENYDYQKGSRAAIRATEETVTSRIPPRVKIRKDAPLELPHVMLLIDNPQQTVIEPLKEVVKGQPPIYDFDLMLGGGHITGWALDSSVQETVLQELAELQRANDGLLFCVGDGNHSLATAKECYRQNPTALSRYALVEVVNIHDDALQFEPIYRAVFGVNPETLIDAFLAECGESNLPDAQKFTCVFGENRRVIRISPKAKLAVGTLQGFLDGYLKKHPEASIDYIHGEESLLHLCQKENTVGFLFDGMEKSQLFPAVDADGSLPRKTFSMGHADDKRFYLEARKIR